MSRKQQSGPSWRKHLKKNHRSFKDCKKFIIFLKKLDPITGISKIRQREIFQVLKWLQSKSHSKSSVHRSHPGLNGILEPSHPQPAARGQKRRRPFGQMTKADWNR